MTLCTAWIRQVNDQEELCFATDSTLTGGEKWNSGIKLFELPRKDCLLCFAGGTDRAYPLILNLVSSIRFDDHLQNQHTDIREVLDYLTELFTNLVLTITEVQGERLHEERGGAKFLFGGWSWEESRFRIWQLSYSKDAEGFIHEEKSVNRPRTVVFLGDPEGLYGKPNIPEIALTKYKELMFEGDSDRPLDMEPLIVLREMSRDKEQRYVDGALQIGKIYRSGVSEFFGIYWPSEKGKPSLHGRDFHPHHKPKVRYYDPDTFEIIEDQLPDRIMNFDEFSYLEDFDFVKSCYDENGCLKSDMHERNRIRLILIFKDHAYQMFIQESDKKTKDGQQGFSEE